MLTSQGRPDSALRLVVLRDWDGLERMLHSLSNMELRRMERVMREEVLPTLDNALFWEALLHLIIFKRSAFIAGVVAVEHLAKDGTLDFRTEEAIRSLETSRGRERKQQFEYDEVTAQIPLTRAELEETLPRAEAASRTVEELKAERKRLREEKKRLTQDAENGEQAEMPPAPTSTESGGQGT